MPEICITVNGERQPWSAALSVTDVVQSRGEVPEAVATALNGVFIARAQREPTLLQPGDALTLFKPIVGG